ncbi:hypothetical protein PGUG_02338 [Meyerozyma guilliermondii ATCC 6260]|uniref:RNB domain-containing protein n=1 Tax=Meyerozyma guilliermondii (strain ATCC 6260 / CBS 566 / DSM 6381 / JCM 1539 / NBRC 10279 / NRRL Y-324) TaxID=294746 RepID=A5DGD7_PICGU|nr:uncharacterized protein PGUG_02338 [Meyerozyma guilliermondii ATCC 6260]EDK38240.2 hypothetical protein PGUG_02338 [Meyerozyma guilliermondii ATCC 6260]
MISASTNINYMIRQRIWRLQGTRQLATSTRTTKRDTEQRYKREKVSNQTKLSNEPADTTREILDQTKSTYYDPENTTLNLNLRNKELLRQIRQATEDRMKKRYEIPSSNWSESLKKQFSKNYSKKFTDQLQRCLDNAAISPDSITKPLGVGDLVTLSDDTMELYIVVAQPETIGSNAYTFINNEGEIVYGSKFMIQMRFPGVIDKELVETLKTFVQLERKYENVAPIGVSDASFSRSEESAPPSMRQAGEKNTKEDVSEPEDSDLNTEFIVASASSQLLTNSNVNTFFVPTSARESYSKSLTSISLSAFNQVPQISRRLEVLHRALQYTEDGDILDSPKTVYIFDMLRYLQLFDEIDVPQEPMDTFCRRLKASIDEKLHQFEEDTSHLGKLVPKMKDVVDRPFHVSTFLASIIAMRTQGRLWKVNQQGSSNPPLSVTVLPLKDAQLIESTLALLMSSNGESAFAADFVGVVNGKKSMSSKFLGVIQLFRDYVAGNFTNDTAIEAKLVSVIRLIDKQLHRREDDVPLLYEYSRARCYELLQQYESVDKSWIENPSAWNASLLSSSPGISLKSDLNSDFYNYLSATALNQQRVEEIEDTEFQTEDPLVSHRESFGPVPIYCIDSEHAHEIDDGIAITSDENNYKISVHVADPTSYVRLFSNLSNVAFEKGTTTYLPEGPIMMLPKFVSEICGLGSTNETRTFVVEFEISKSLLQEFRNPQSHGDQIQSVLEAVANQVKTSSNVRYCTATNFPQKFTYSKVNEVLNSPTLSDDTKSCEHAKNLVNLYDVARLLHNARVYTGNAIDTDIPRSSVSVSYAQKGKPGLVESEHGYEMTLQHTHGDKGYPVISIGTNPDQAADSKSQTLVSNLMVAANTAASQFASSHGIELVHRAQEISLEKSVLEQLQNLTRRRYETATPLSVEETSQVLSVLTSAKYKVGRDRHEALGVEGYATVTSPLRRYVDMVNHWKFQEYFLGKPLLSLEQLHYICHHLQARELINKQVQVASSKFWEGIFFREYTREQRQKINFQLLLRSHPQFGVVRVNVVGFNNLRAKLEPTPNLIQKFKDGTFTVGKVAEGPFEISKLDLIEDEVCFRLSE